MGLCGLCLDMGIYFRNTEDSFSSLASKKMEAYMITLSFPNNLWAWWPVFSKHDGCGTGKIEVSETEVWQVLRQLKAVYRWYRAAHCSPYEEQPAGCPHTCNPKPATARADIRPPGWEWRSSQADRAGGGETKMGWEIPFPEDANPMTPMAGKACEQAGYPALLGSMQTPHQGKRPWPCEIGA